MSGPKHAELMSRRAQQASDRGWQVYPHACGVAQVWHVCLAFGYWSLFPTDRMF